MIKEELRITEHIILTPKDRDKEAVLKEIREDGFSNPAIWDYTVKIFRKS
ncbi:MAG: hypothetical protein ACFFAK_13105 [Promethearchaeota archaeon]